MRLFFEEGEGKLMKKHRYAFYFNELGLINGVLYVPPFLLAHYDELSQEKFNSYMNKVNHKLSIEKNDTNFIKESYINLSCTAVMTPIEESYPTLNNNSRKNKIPYQIKIK